MQLVVGAEDREFGADGRDHRTAWLGWRLNRDGVFARADTLTHNSAAIRMATALMLSPTRARGSPLQHVPRISRERHRSHELACVDEWIAMEVLVRIALKHWIGGELELPESRCAHEIVMRWQTHIEMHIRAGVTRVTNAAP